MIHRGELPCDPERFTDDRLAMAWALRRRLEYSAARTVARAVVTAHRAPDASPDSELAEGQLLLGRLEEDLGDPEAAEAAYNAAVTAAETVVVPARYTVLVRALTRLVAVLRDRGAMREADAAIAQALVVAEFHLADGVEHAEAVAEQSRHLLYHGVHEEAEQLAIRALAMVEAAPPGIAREETRTSALGARGTVLRVRGHYDEAYPVLRDALATAEATFGRGSVEVGGALNDLGICGKFSGRFDEGIEHYLRALAVFGDAVGSEHPSVATVYHNLGGILHARQDFEAAEPWARRSVELRERLLGPDHVAVALDRAALASILSGLGRYDEAEGLLRQALSCLEEKFGPENHDVIANYGNLAGIARRRGDLDEAERLYRHALAVKERLLGPDHPEVATTLNNLAVVCRRRGDLDEAEVLYRRAIDVWSQTVEPTHPALAASRNNLSRLLQDRKRAGYG